MPTFTLNSIDGMCLTALVLSIKSRDEGIISDLDVCPFATSDQGICVGLICRSYLAPINYGQGISVVDYLIIVRPFHWCLSGCTDIVKLSSSIYRKITDSPISDR
jgi:hypothetical protein